MHTMQQVGAWLCRQGVGGGHALQQRLKGWAGWKEKFG